MKDEERTVKKDSMVQKSIWPPLRLILAASRQVPAP